MPCKLRQDLPCPHRCIDYYFALWLRSCYNKLLLMKTCVLRIDCCLDSSLSCTTFLTTCACAQLYVAHLDPRASEEDVRQLFSNHGNVLHVRIIQDRDTGMSKGYGFVTMAAPNMAQVCCSL